MLSEELREVNPADSELEISASAILQLAALEADDLEHTRLFKEKIPVVDLDIFLGHVCPYGGFVLLKLLPLVNRGAVDHVLGIPVT
jgi:hypothetical protein